MKNIIIAIFIFGCEIIFSQNVDTLRVSQNDTIFFIKIGYISHRPCSKAKIVTSYRLRNPKNSVYYYIYNDKKQLVKEGKYTSQYIYEDVKYDGGFYNLKYYNYRKNGSLSSIHYQKDGRNAKTEYYSRKNKLKRIRYIDKKTDTPTKTEYYKNNKLKETRVFTNFYANKYYTIKEKKESKTK